MNLGIVGSRKFAQYDLMKKIILENVDINKIKCVVSGGAEGADTLGKKFADEYNKTPIVFPAEWEKYGKPAGFRRNMLIVKESDIVFAFWNGTSSGTRDTIEKTIKLRKPLVIVSYLEPDDRMIKKFNCEMFDETI